MTEPIDNVGEHVARMGVLRLLPSPSLDRFESSSPWRGRISCVNKTENNKKKGLKYIKR